MKTIRKILVCVLTIQLAAEFSAAFAQNNSAPENPQPLSGQQVAKIKARWNKVLNDALREFQNNNDQDSASFVSGMISSLDQPGGMVPAALAGYLASMKSHVRELVRRGAMESAAAMNCAQVQVSYTPNFAPPIHPNHKTGGTPDPSGLVLYLPFDKPDANGVIHDESSAGNDAQVFGAQWVAEGKFGGAYHFSLTNFDDRIVIPNSDSLNPEYLTVAAWIKVAGNNGFWRRILDKDCWYGYDLTLGGDEKGKMNRGKLQFEGQVNIGADRVLDDNQWHHVAATFDGKTACCYVDGVEKSRPVRSPGPLKGTSWDLCIGNSVVNYGTGELLAFDGLIDEVRIYNRALLPSEIKALAAATHAGADILPAPVDAAPKPDAAERLKKLKSLYDQGLINKEDYDKKVKEIMDSI